MIYAINKSVQILSDNITTSIPYVGFFLFDFYLKRTNGLPPGAVLRVLVVVTPLECSLRFTM